MEDLYVVLVEQVRQQSVLEVVAVTFSLLYPWLAARQNILCWPAALISTTLYVYIFWEVSLPFNSLLNMYYLVMAIYGWLRWQKTTQNDVLKVSVVPLVVHLWMVSLLVVMGLALPHLVTLSWQGSDLYLDAFVTVFSVYATYLMANKVLENWLFWIVINTFAAYLYFINGLLLTGVMFIWYFGLAIYGYIKWKKAYKVESLPEEAYQKI
ncbi:nicotinamide riboside transporter PnuC [Aliiglaciecola sp. 2_MG-2023]|uniref:nicotinamide riboside transporter PnuC n=1 Tax=Alteromonadaceae TaxID=72275 RepID=UPI0026E15432|nr:MULTISPECIES: nicotinamide riboside transporter PnuC [unclassified Aliiglaciecola]MDO6709848.1 nicotinamide riboside transporter PnuC [Aliiglaciecola sp. 2_MG-2023]MDO6750996.1 nicotinamide riboside transporter PnuC [Aliiglaciecola sp. 1_MG-2023]